MTYLTYPRRRAYSPRAMNNSLALARCFFFA